MADDFSRVSIYLPKSNQPEKPIKRLYELGLKRDRSLNYMMVAAILDYVNREEKKKKK
jgi:predicted transcriptional regulator